MGLKKIYNVPKIKATSLARDHTGEVMGDLTILHPTRRDKAHLLWAAECKCGTMVELRAAQIDASIIDSCGRCRPLPYVTLRELPYKLEDAFRNISTEVVELDRHENVAPTEQDVAELVEEIDELFETAVTPTAWQVAERCISAIEPLSDDDRTKALNLIKVQLGYVV